MASQGSHRFGQLHLEWIPRWKVSWQRGCCCCRCYTQETKTSVFQPSLSHGTISSHWNNSIAHLQPKILFKKMHNNDNILLMYFYVWAYSESNKADILWGIEQKGLHSFKSKVTQQWNVFALFFSITWIWIIFHGTSDIISRNTSVLWHRSWQIVL